MLDDARTLKKIRLGKRKLDPKNIYYGSKSSVACKGVNGEKALPQSKGLYRALIDHLSSEEQNNPPKYFINRIRQGKTSSPAYVKRWAILKPVNDR
jgi:hypothetical protein